MINLRSVLIEHKVQLLLVYTPFLASVVISFLDVLPKYLIDYKLPMMLILLIASILYTYILLLKNYIRKLEEKNNIHTDLSNEFNEKEIFLQIKNLTRKEKEHLKKFIDRDERILKFLRTDEIAEALESIGILKNISPPESLFPTYSYKISDVYWNYLKKNSKKIMFN